MGLAVWNETCFFVDVAIAPLLTEKIRGKELAEPKLGTQIFHLSPLPYGRGASSIRWAYKRKEPITAATWFWADSGLDTGDICEQEVVRIDYNLRPRDFYEQEIIPAMQKTLKRCLNNLRREFNVKCHRSKNTHLSTNGFKRTKRTGRYASFFDFSHFALEMMNISFCGL